MMFSQLNNIHGIIKGLVKALIRLPVCVGWSEPLLVAHTTLLQISLSTKNVMKFDTARVTAKAAEML